MEHEIPVGFRFYPTEVELISFYLRFQLHGGNATIHSLIPILDVFSVEPTQLPSTCAIIISYIIVSLILINNLTYIWTQEDYKDTSN